MQGCTGGFFPGGKLLKGALRALSFFEGLGGPRQVNVHDSLEIWYAGRALLGEPATNLALLTVSMKGVAGAPLGAKVVEQLNQHAATDYSGATIALLTALPFGAAALVMLFMAKHSAVTGGSQPPPLRSANQQAEYTASLPRLNSQQMS